MSNIKENWSDRTTINVSDNLRDKLKDLKIRKGEKLSSVLKRILATIEKYNLEIITEEILED